MTPLDEKRQLDTPIDEPILLHTPVVTSEDLTPMEPATPAVEAEATTEILLSETEKHAAKLQDQTNLLPPGQVLWVFTGITCSLFCSLLDQTIVATSLPTISTYFNDATTSSWVGTAYLLTSTCVQPIYGRMSDIYGRKAIMLLCIGIFFFSSLACALASSMLQLIIFRAFQGIGGGGITTVGMIIISDVVSLRDRGKYQGIMGGVTAVSNSLGPIIGGLLSEKVSWRWCFYINLPMTALSGAIIFFLLPLRPVDGNVMEKLKQLDKYGSLLTLLWSVAVVIGLSWAGVEFGWTSAAVLVPIILGFALLFVFIYVEAKLVKLPIIPIYIFRSSTVSASMITTFCNGAAFFTSLYYLPEYFQVVRDASPIRSGILLLPLSLVQTALSVGAGYFVAKTGDYKWNLLAGFAIWTVGLGLMSMVNPTTAIGAIIGFEIIVGLGAGQTFQTNLLAIQAAVARHDMAAATSCRNFLRSLGGTFALALCATIKNNIVKTQLKDAGMSSSLVSQVITDPTKLSSYNLDASQVQAVKAAFSKAVDGCYWLMIPLTGLSVFITLFFVKKISLNRADDDAKRDEAKKWLAERKGAAETAKV